LCIQRTKAHADQLSDALKNIPGYTSYFCSWREERVFRRGDLYKGAAEEVVIGCGESRFDVEGRIICAGTKISVFLIFIIPTEGAARSAFSTSLSL